MAVKSTMVGSRVKKVRTFQLLPKGPRTFLTLRFLSGGARDAQKPLWERFSHWSKLRTGTIKTSIPTLKFRPHT